MHKYDRRLIINILGKRSFEQREKIANEYKALKDDLKRTLGDLDSDLFKDAVLHLFDTKAQLDDKLAFKGSTFWKEDSFVSIEFLKNILNANCPENEDIDEAKAKEDAENII